MDADERAVQLYTLEYQKAAERYDNVYRSMWTIFSYMTAVAAGILTFGSDRIEPDALICFAAIPLLFWFWTTYLPLDRYGNSTANRLRELEGVMNASFNTKLNHFTGFAHPLRIFRGREPAERAKMAWLGHVWNQVKRARFAICFCFIALNLLFLYELCMCWNLHKRGRPLFREKPSAGGSSVTIVSQ